MVEKKIKNYFLGELSETEKAVFEEEIAADKTLFEQAQMIESEIIEQYLRRNLTSAERDSFEKNYPISRERQRKIEFTRDLLNNLKESPNEKRAFFESFFAFFNFSRACAAAVLLIAIGGFSYFAFRNISPQTEIVKQVNTNQTPVFSEENNRTGNTNIDFPAEKNTSNLMAETNRRAPNNTFKPTPTPTPKADEKRLPIFATFTLLSGTLRSGGEQFINISPNSKQIILRLKLPAEAAAYQKFRAQVKTSEGITVAEFSNLKRAEISLPSAKLSNRTYIVFLEGINAENQTESIAEYTFRVKK